MARSGPLEQLEGLCVCVVEMEKRDIAEGCRKYDRGGWGERRS